MALQKCHECGKKVSTEADKCPNCGAPVIVKMVSQEKIGEEIGCLGVRKSIWVFLLIFIIAWFIYESLMTRPPPSKDDLKKWGANWVEYHSQEGDYLSYYDKDSVEKSSGKVKVWAAHKYGDNSKSREMFIAAHKVLGLQSWKYKDLHRTSYTKVFYEIECDGKGQFRIIMLTHYDKYGEGLYANLTPSPWDNTRPVSPVGSLRTIVCK